MQHYYLPWLRVWELYHHSVSSRPGSGIRFVAPNATLLPTPHTPHPPPTPPSRKTQNVRGWVHPGLSVHHKPPVAVITCLRWFYNHKLSVSYGSRERWASFLSLLRGLMMCAQSSTFMARWSYSMLAHYTTSLSSLQMYMKVMKCLSCTLKCLPCTFCRVGA